MSGKRNVRRKSKTGKNWNLLRLLKPKRKRWTANKLTIETLIALHSENPAGIGFVSDEILGILNGLGQFKGGKGMISKSLSVSLMDTTLRTRLPTQTDMCVMFMSQCLVESKMTSSGK